MSRLRLVAALVLWAVAARWAVQALAELLTRTWRPGPPSPRPDGRLRAGQRCPDCFHRSGQHDPDLGCIATIAGDGGWEGCPCRRLGCRCPKLDPPGDQ